MNIVKIIKIVGTGVALAVVSYLTRDKEADSEDETDEEEDIILDRDYRDEMTPEEIEEMEQAHRDFYGDEDDDDDNDKLDGCAACGNPAYPRCMDSCPLCDD